MSRPDRITRTVEAAAGFEDRHGPWRPDPADLAHDARPPGRIPRARCTQYRDPFEEPVPQVRWAHVAGCDRSCMGEVAA